MLEKGLNTEYKGKYLIMSTGKDAKLGFLGHTDTVEYIDGWETNPLELIKIDNKEKVTDFELQFTQDMLLNDKYILVQKGKKNYYLLIVK